MGTVKSGCKQLKSNDIDQTKRALVIKINEGLSVRVCTKVESHKTRTNFNLVKLWINELKSNQLSD